jgi:nucleotide-binding universal stress UspA family protein
MAGDKEKIGDERIFQKILVPLDGSESAEMVLELAQNLSVRSGAELTLFHVFPPEQTKYERLHSIYIKQIAENAERSISKICETVACHFKGVSATTAPVLVKGEPAEEIVRYATSNNFSVILMATHGRSQMINSARSDIANHVVRTSPVPVWLVRTLAPNEIVCAEWPPQRVLVPLDGSPRAEKILPYVVEYAKLLNAEIVLLRICEKPAINSDYPFPDWEKHIEVETVFFQERCGLYLNEVEQRIKREGLKITKECWLGNAAEEIVGYIGRNRCDLVAMTAYGRSAMPGWVSDSSLVSWVFSNVTEQVLATTTRGILLVRP